MKVKSAKWIYSILHKALLIQIQMVACLSENGIKLANFMKCKWMKWTEFVLNPLSPTIRRLQNIKIFSDFHHNIWYFQNLCPH